MTEVFSSSQSHLTEAEIEQELSEKLLDGFTLLERACPACTTPLVKQMNDDVPKSTADSTTDSHSAESSAAPMPGIPYCVQCQAHVITEQKEMDIFEKSDEENKIRARHGKLLMYGLMSHRNGNPDDPPDNESKNDRLPIRIKMIAQDDALELALQPDIEERWRKLKVIADEKRQKLEVTNKVLETREDQVDQEDSKDQNREEIVDDGLMVDDDADQEQDELTTHDESSEFAKDHQNSFWPTYEERRDLAVKVLGVRLLQGYKLEERQCPRCEMPLMKQTHQVDCVVCPFVDQFMLQKDKKTRIALQTSTQKRESIALEKEIQSQRQSLRSRRTSLLEDVKKTALKQSTREEKSVKSKPKIVEAISSEKNSSEEKNLWMEITKFALKQLVLTDNSMESSIHVNEIEGKERTSSEILKALDIKHSDSQQNTKHDESSKKDCPPESPKMRDSSIADSSITTNDSLTHQESMGKRIDISASHLGKKGSNSTETSSVDDQHLNWMGLIFQSAFGRTPKDGSMKASSDKLVATSQSQQHPVETQMLSSEIPTHDRIDHSENLLFQEKEKRFVDESRNFENACKILHSAKDKLDQEQEEFRKKQVELDYAFKQASEKVEIEAKRMEELEQLRSEMESTASAQLSTLFSSDEIQFIEKEKVRLCSEIKEASSAREQAAAECTTIAAKKQALQDTDNLSELHKHYLEKQNEAQDLRRKVQTLMKDIALLRKRKTCTDPSIPAWESLRAEIRETVERRLEAGWKLLEQSCEGVKCHYAPLLFYGELRHCVVCGGGGSGKDGIYENRHATIGNEEVAKSSTNLIKSVQDDIHDNFESKRDFVSKEIGKKLLSGWMLLDLTCPRCVMPMLADSGGNHHCVLCDTSEQTDSESLNSLHDDKSGQEFSKESVSPDDPIRSNDSISVILEWRDKRKSTGPSPRGDPPAVQGYTLRRKDAKDADNSFLEPPAGDDENKEKMDKVDDDRRRKDLEDAEMTSREDGDKDKMDKIYTLSVPKGTDINDPSTLRRLVEAAKAMNVNIGKPDKSSKNLPSPGMGTGQAAKPFSETPTNSGSVKSRKSTHSRARVTPETLNQNISDGNRSSSKKTTSASKSIGRVIIPKKAPNSDKTNLFAQNELMDEVKDIYVLGGPLQTGDFDLESLDGSVTTQAIDELLERIDETKRHLENPISLDDQHDVEKQNKLAQLLDNLACAASAMQKYDNRWM